MWNLKQLVPVAQWIAHGALIEQVASSSLSRNLSLLNITVADGDPWRALGLVASPSPDYWAWSVSPGPLKMVSLSRLITAVSAIIMFNFSSAGDPP